MSSTSTAQKARLFDLSNEVMDLVREGHRDPDEVARVLQGIKEDPEYLLRLFAGTTPTFDVWQTITIGGKSKDELIATITNSGMFVSDWARDIMSKDAFVTLPEPRTVRLARCRVKDLGFTKNPTTTQIFARIKEVGGELCSPEVGPHLRLHLKDQPKGDYFWVAMETITASGGYPDLFCLPRRGLGGSWLDADVVHPDDQWPLEDVVVFVLSK